MVPNSRRAETSKDLALSRRAWLAGGVAGTVGASAAAAQSPRSTADPAPAESPTPRPAAPPAAGARRLPADKTTQHALAMPDGRALRFAATAGTILLSDPQGAPEAEIAFIAYRLDAADARARPVAFVLNGGPGASSAWLHLGALGPWRLPIGGDAPSSSALRDLAANAETWLDFTDLVFLDPVGTGYSGFLAPGDAARGRYWSVEGDIRSLAEAIRRWLEANGRVASPKSLVGESYGGFRVPRLARALQQDHGVGIGGLVLVSPALDMGGNGPAAEPLQWAVRLPSMAAAARAARGEAVGAPLFEAERYAVREYLPDVFLGERDAAALARIEAGVAASTGLDPDFVRRRHGRIETEDFLRELGRGSGRVASPYDAAVSGPDAFPLAAVGRNPDPILDGLMAPLTGAMLGLYADRLDWRPEGRRYEVLNRSVNREWQWGRSGERPEAVTALRTALAFDVRLRVLVAHGLFDLVTPYFATKLLLDQIPDRAGGDRVRSAVYPGGHMFYSIDASRTALREDARTLFRADAER